MTGEKKPEESKGGDFDDLFNTDTGGGSKEPPAEEEGDAAPAGDGGDAAPAEGAGDMDLDLSGIEIDEAPADAPAEEPAEAPGDGAVEEAVEEPGSIMDQRIAVVRKVLEGKGFMPEKIEAAVQMMLRSPPPAEFRSGRGERAGRHPAQSPVPPR